MMTREQRDRAIEVAKDIIAQIVAANSYRITQGVYFEPAVFIDEMKGDVKDHIDLIQSGCEVCMLGAAMLSKARLFDAVPVESVRCGGRDQMTAALADVFDPETMDCMEAAFETTTVNAEDETDRVRGAVVFGLQFCRGVERAVAVARNIIDNDGLFVVEPVSESDYDYEDDYEDDDETEEPE